MSLKQKPNKHLRTKSNHRTTTAGSRAKRRLHHGKNKTPIKRSAKKR